MRYPVGQLAAWMPLLAMVGAATAWASSERPAPDPKAGRAAYVQSCARCHGIEGKGDGVDAQRFYPRPRDLALGVYKFRTTASGTPPTDEDLFQTITHGLPGSNMPDWKHLSDATRWQLVYYLKSLSPALEQAPVPVTLSGDPGATQADLKKGRAVYEQLGCAACHGSLGRANGTSAAGLVDDWGMPIRPANLTQGWSYRGGHDPRSIMMRFMTGIDGAGMPSYAEATTPDDAWQLAYYVASLQEPAHWRAIAHAMPADGLLPSSADDPRWAQAESTTLRLRNVVAPGGEWAQPPTVTFVRLQVAADADTVAFRLIWDDPKKNGEEPSDRLAVALKSSGPGGDVVSLQAWPYQGAQPLDVCGWSAASMQVTEKLAVDFDGPMSPAARGTPLDSVASYDEGRWTLMIRRPLRPEAPKGAAVFERARFTSVAFSVWDGSNPEARAVSSWVDIALPNDSRHAQTH